MWEFLNRSPRSSNATKTAAAVSGHDASVKNRADDLLDRWPTAALIKRLILSAPADWSTRIGLYGPWGSGKTSVLNFLEQQLQAEGHIYVHLTAWDVAAETGVVRLIHTRLLEHLRSGGVKAPIWSRIRAKLESIRKAAVGLVGVAKTAGDLDPVPSHAAVKAAATALEHALDHVSRYTTISIEQFEPLLRVLGADRRIVIAIDDLDRADPAIVPRTLLALRELLDYPRFAFVLAFDPVVIGAALGSYNQAFAKNADHFLEKVIDIPVTLDRATEANAARMASRMLEDKCPFIPEANRLEAARFFPANPRLCKQIVRILGTYSETASRFDPDELAWTAIQLHVALRAAHPGLAAIMEASGFSERGDWLIFAFEEKERGKRIGEMLERAGVVDASAENDWLKQLLENVIISRGYTSRVEVERDMSLPVRGPAITRLEVRQLAEASPRRLEEALQTALDRAAAATGAEAQDCAAAIVKIVIEQYGLFLDQAANIGDGNANASALSDAGRHLAVLEYLWRETHIASYSTVLASTAVIHAFYSCVMGWVAFRRNAEEPALRGRELSLLEAAATASDDPLSLYSRTAPMRRDPFDRSQDPEHSYQALAVIREPLIARAMAEVIGWFAQVEGVNKALTHRSEDHGCRQWILSAEDSPLYDEPHRRALLEALTPAIGISEATHRILALNALQYLRIISGIEAAGWSRDPGRFAHANDEILAAAWRLATAFVPQFRMRSSYADLRRRLIGMTGTDELFLAPDWIHYVDPPEAEPG